jgi:hypothetical protein
MMLDFIVYINGNISQIMPKSMEHDENEMRQSSEAGEHGEGDSNKVSDMKPSEVSTDSFN